MNLEIVMMLVLAAMLEVGGDAMIRTGLQRGRALFIVAGILALGCYGLSVNSVRWDFSRLLGIYVAVFAVTSVATGWLVFRESIPAATWIGLGVIVGGGLIIQLGAKWV